MTHTKVHWLLDGVVAKTHPNDWGEVIDLSHRLIDIIGNKEISHEIVDPVGSFQKLSRRLVDLPISTIIDISGWIGYGLKPLFPDAELITDFSISRIMDISSKDSTTAGFVINISPHEAKKRAEKLDLSNMLIVDDATVSGRTNRIVLDIWGIDPTSVTHASLFVNIGDYPKVEGRYKKRGASIYLEGLGSRVIYGDTMVSPQDEAWHLLDVFEHPNLDKVFASALKSHDIGDASGTYTEKLRRSFSDTDPEVDLFPQQIAVPDLAKLTEGERFFRNPVHKATERSLYCRNPLLWMYSDFWLYIDNQSLRERKDEALRILNRLQLLTSDADNVFEVRQTLIREALVMINGKTIDGDTIRREIYG